MVKGTTPTFTLTVGDGSVDLDEALSVYVTIQQFDKIITKSGSAVTVDHNVVTCTLTENESLRFIEGIANVQVNWTYRDAGSNALKRAASKVASVPILKQLLDEVIAK